LNGGAGALEETQRCFKRDPFPFVGLHPKGKDVSEKYGVKTCPANFIIGRDGRIRARFSGFPVAGIRQALKEAAE